MVSTVVETDSPELEIKPALDRLQPIEQTFTTISDLYEPTSAGLDLNLFVAPSYDAASHFESATEDVKVMLKKRLKLSRTQIQNCAKCFCLFEFSLCF